MRWQRASKQVPRIERASRAQPSTVSAKSAQAAATALRKACSELLTTRLFSPRICSVITDPKRPDRVEALTRFAVG